MILIDFSEWRPAGQGAAHGAGRSFWYISQCPLNKFGFFIGERPKPARGMIFTPAAVTRRRIKKQKWRGGGKCSSRIPKKKFSNAYWPVSGISPITERLSLLVYNFITFTADSDRILPFVGRVVAAGRTVTCHDARRTPYQETNRSKKATTFIPLIRFDFPRTKNLSQKA